MSSPPAVPSVSVTYARNGSSAKANELGMRVMQERAYEKRGEQYLLIKSPPASGKSRALMFIALDKLHNQGLRQAIIVVPRSRSGRALPTSRSPGSASGPTGRWSRGGTSAIRQATDGGKVNSVGTFLESADRVLVCTHATFRFAWKGSGSRPSMIG